jgi:predicted NAD/FAD-binding protein
MITRASTPDQPVHPAAASVRRVAVIGSGIAGLATARGLASRCEVTLFESEPRLGGHAHTVDVAVDGRTVAVDTGFLVFNPRTYPNLLALFQELAVETIASTMTFGVSLDDGAFEWAGTSLDTVFAQRHRALSPRFLGMLRDILRFNRNSAEHLAHAERHGGDLGALLASGGYGTAFRDDYLLPMAAAIWSSPSAEVLRFPAATFLRFCMNHSLLQVDGRPVWGTVQGGSRRYVDRLAEGLADVRLACPVERVWRRDGGVVVRSRGADEPFDAVVFATHAPDTLALLGDADGDERRVLGSVRYQDNDAVLHTDPRLLPRRAKVRSAWNYLGRHAASGERPVCVSYWLNPLQSLPVDTPVVLTLNPFVEPGPQHLLGRWTYAHPLFDAAAIAAQQALPDLQGRRATWFAGAWTGYGFHEDGLRSALRVLRDFGRLPSWAVLP